MYGYLIVTLTWSPVFGPAVHVIRLEILAHCVAETVFWIAVVAAPHGPLVRLTAAARAPTRAASVIAR